jgi:hypothetical protein
VKTGADGRWSIATSTPRGGFIVDATVGKKKTKRAICRPTRSADVSFPDAPPILDVTAPPVGLTGPSGPISYTVNEPTVVVCTLDSAPLDPCDGYSGLVAGNHELVVTATDPSGGFTSVTIQFFVDTAGPIVTITNPTEGGFFGSPVILDFTAADASGPTSARCSVDLAPLDPCTSPAFFGFINGSHSITVEATDRFGNVGSATVNFTVG